MKILKNYIYNMSYQVLVLIVPLITMPYISRVLGPSGVGIYSYTNSLISYFVLFSNLGITLYGNRQIAFLQKNKEKRSRVFFEICTLKLVATSISFIFLVIFLLIYRRYTVLILAQSLILFANAFDVSWYFMGMEDFKKTVLRNIIVKILSLFLIFGLVHSKNDLLTYILILGGSALTGNILLLPFLSKQIDFSEFKNLKIIKHFHPAILLFLPQLATQIYLVLNKIMLGNMDSIDAVGFFSSSDNIIRLSLTIVSSLSAVLMPRIASLIAEGKNKSVEKYMERSFEFIMFLSFPLMLGLMAIAHKFIPLFLGGSFKIVSKLVILESPVIILISLSIAITNQYLIPAKKNAEYIISTIIGAVANLVINIILIPKMGVFGAVIATNISELLVMIFLIYSIRNVFSFDKKVYLNYLKYITSGLVMYFIVVWINNNTPSSFVFVFLEALTGLVLYIVILLVMKVNIVVNWRHFFDV